MNQSQENPQNESGKQDSKTQQILREEKYFMAVAILTAKRSPDPGTQVGACVVCTEDQTNKTIVSTGYNKMPDRCDGAFPWARDGSNELEKKYLYVCHSELNAIVNARTRSVKGCSMYVTRFPCNDCAKVIVQSGIAEVIYLSDKRHDDVETEASRRILNKAGVRFRGYADGSSIELNFDFKS